MLSYIRFNCLSCEKVLEYGISSDFGPSLEIHNVPPILAMMVDGGTLVCSCRHVHIFRYNKDNKMLEVISYI